MTRLGCRAEYLFGPDRPRDGTEAHAAGNFALERYMHLHALNRGVLLTPFHNMALMSPATSEADVDRHTEVFREAVHELGSLRTAWRTKFPQFAAIARDRHLRRPESAPLGCVHLSRRAFGFAGSVSFCAGSRAPAPAVAFPR